MITFLGGSKWLQSGTNVVVPALVFVIVAVVSVLDVEDLVLAGVVVFTMVVEMGGETVVRQGFDCFSISHDVLQKAVKHQPSPSVSLYICDPDGKKEWGVMRD